MSVSSPYIVRAGDVPAYSPAGHTGTRNYRLVAPGVNGARLMEVVLGDIEQSAGVSEHAHPGMEQAQYIIEGTAEVVVEGVRHSVGPGDMLFFPPDVFHAVTVTSPRMKALIIYSPPYGEAADKVVRRG